MAAVRGSNTKPEIALRRALHGRGLRYRLSDRRLPGSPDLVFPRYRAALFVHGCFWHRHRGCRKTTTPKANRDFWAQKFRANTERDRRSLAALAEDGWRVAIVWQCGIGRAPPPELVTRVEAFVKGDDGAFLELPEIGPGAH